MGSTPYPPLSIHKKTKCEKGKAEDPLDLSLKWSSTLAATSSGPLSELGGSFWCAFKQAYPQLIRLPEAQTWEAPRHGLIEPSHFTEERPPEHRGICWCEGIGRELGLPSQERTTHVSSMRSFQFCFTWKSFLYTVGGLVSGACQVPILWEASGRQA